MMGLERTALPTSWGRIGPECLNLTVPSIILPLLAEPLFDTSPGRFTRMLEAANDAGLQLFVTPGVVEEIERHMNRALTCSRMRHGEWISWVPYLFEQYASSGRSSNSFGNWLEVFRGDFRPEEDISEYLDEQLGIQTRSLEAGATLRRCGNKVKAE